MSQNIIQPYRYGGVSQVSMENYDDPMSMQKDGTESYGYTFSAGHTILGSKIVSVWFYLKAGYGTITSGTITTYCGQDTSDPNNNVAIGSIAASSLSTSEFEWIEFTGTSEPTVLENDVVWIQYSALGDQRCEIRYYGNSPSGLGVTANFWGNGGGLPAGNTQGTTNDGATLINWQQNDATIGVAPELDSAPYFHPMRIKIDYS